MSNPIIIRELLKTEPVPYRLLLLADEEMQAIERYINQSDIHVTEIDNKIVGVYALYPLDEKTAEIKAIAVDEDYQNQGIGKLLLKHAFEVTQKSGFSELLIGTPSIAEKQLSIYRKAGFTLFDIKKDFFITNYSEPIFEDGVQLKDMAMLKKIF
jgi:N-acetylglutamate synthase-like GNAT family acetyltransferase